MTLDKHEYIHKMESLFADSNTYENLRRNPGNKIITELKLLLKGWKHYEYPLDYNCNNLNCIIPILSLAYGLSKIHKIECPLRIIVSSIGSLLHNLASFLRAIRNTSSFEASVHLSN